MKKRFIYIFGIFVIFFIGFLWWENNIQPADTTNTTQRQFIIEKGTGLKQIAFNLKDNGFIRDPYAFILAVRYLGIENSIQAGTFTLTSNLDTFSIAKRLTKGTNDVRVTIPEGKRAEEIAELVTQQIPTIDKNELVQKLTTHEGYLFPDTYEFQKDATVDDIVQKMTNTFDQKYATLPQSSSRSKEDIVNVASMIEREAQHPEDRPIIASVIYNRLDIGMKLDIDSSVQFALGYDQDGQTWWKKNLTAQDLAIDSPYNTYTHVGLPPTPISNPGLAALQAAITPANTNYFFYFTDKQGINHYSRTLEEQTANIKRFGI